MSIYLGTTPLAVNAASYRVGQIIESITPQADAGLHLLDGSQIVGGGMYNEFVQYIAGLSLSNPELFLSEEDWQAAVTAYGVCGKFVYDMNNDTVRLPKFYASERYLVESYVDGTDWYRIYSDGWCEQGGNYTLSSNNSSISISFLKPFNNTNYSILVSKQVNNNYDQSVYAPKIRTRSTTGFIGTCNVDVADSLFIWQTCGYISTTDFEPAVKYNYIVIATAPKLDIEADIDEIATDLNGKVDKSDLVQCHVVVETYHDGASWYRIWDDGWCEQGNTISMYSSNTIINLLKSFEDTNYAVQLSYEGTSARGDVPSVNTKTTSTFKVVHTAGLDSGFALTWEAKGYIEV